MMTFFKPLVLILILSQMLLIISEGYIFDYNVFALQWTPALCRSIPRCYNIPVADFYVHGLWPSNYYTQDPAGCIQFDSQGQALPNYGQPFDYGVCNAAPMKNDLDNRWPNIAGPINIKFWKREWDKHGTCMYELFDQTQYFSTVINLFDNIHPVMWLSLGGIIPDPTKDYQPLAIKQAIANANGNAFPRLVCSGITGIYELLEIRFCLDATATQFINCTSPDVRCGPSTIKWYI